MSEEITVRSLLLDIYSLTQAEKITVRETGEEISVQDLQGLVFQNVETLSELLGIDLDKE